MTAVASLERLRIGQVVETTFDVVYRDARILIPLALLFVGLPSAIVGWLQTEFGAAASVGGFATIITQSLLQGAVMYAVAANLNGQPRSFQAALSKAVQLLWPLVGLGVLQGLGILLGLVLLVVPGVILVCIWAVAAPVRVVEGPTVSRAFGRSRTLTKGYRGQIFLLFLAYAAAVIVISFVAGLAGIVGGEFFVNVILSPIVETGTGLIGTAGAAALYYELRRIKEGAGPESLASVFD